MATPAAAQFARKLKLALREVQWAVDEVDAAKGNFGGEIVIGAMLLAGSVVLASVLNEFASEYPNANIRVLNGNAEDMLRYLRAVAGPKRGLRPAPYQPSDCCSRTAIASRS
jgi:LysR family transcriptional regulator of gallate degradation